MKNYLNLVEYTRNLFFKSLFLLIVCAAWQSAWAAPVDSKKATSVVQGWLKIHKRPLNEMLGNAVLRVESFKDATGNVAYHIVYLNHSGFVIVSGDDLAEPIVGFVEKGVFDPSDKNPLGAMVSRDLPARVAWARKSVATTNKAAADWNKFTQAATNTMQLNFMNSVTDVRVAPFVQTTWGQITTVYDQPSYNYYTPPYEAGNPNNYPCGCVGTAMAQMMRYYQYPTIGVGTQSFNITVDGKGQSCRLRGGDGFGGPYNWANMPNNPVDANSDIGALTADAGVAVGMSYAAAGSYSNLRDAQGALINTFHYTSAGYGKADFGSGLGNNDLITMINPNLDAHMPVMLGILRDGGGHAIVVDGYGYSGSTLYHHLNLGWDGVSTAWYNLPTIDTSVGYTYYLVQECIYNLYTNGTGEIISGRVLDQNSQPVENATVTATHVSGGTWTATTDAKGIYALTRLPSDSQYTIFATKDGYDSSTTTYSTGASIAYKSYSGNIWGVNFSLSNQPKAIDHFGWAINNDPVIGAPFNVTLSAFDKNNGKANFSGTANIRASTAFAVSNCIIGDLGNHGGGFYYGGSTTLGYTFIPNTDLLPTAFRTLFGTKVSIWGNSGTLLVSQSVTNNGSSVVTTPLNASITLKAGNKYTIGLYCPEGTLLNSRVTEWPLPFLHGNIYDDAFGAGDAFPANTSPSQLIMVDLSYTCHEINPIAIAPTVSGTFSNGIWTGDITLLQSVSNIVLRADDGAGHFGSIEISQLSGQSNAVDHFGWIISGNPAINNPFNVTISASDIANGMAHFTRTVNISATFTVKSTNVLIGNLVGSNEGAMSFYQTLGYDITPNTDIQVIAVRSYFGTKVSIWDSAGTLLVSRNVSNQPGTWIETPLITPVTLKSGSTYRIGIFCPANTGRYLVHSSVWPSSFPHGTMGGTFFTFADAFPTGKPSSGILIDLRYYTCDGNKPLAITPAVSGPFSNGIWTGDITLIQSGSDILLRADDGAGHFGTYGPFNLGIPQLTLAPSRLDFGDVPIGGNAFQTFTLTNTGAGILCGSATAKEPFNVVSGSPFSIPGGQTGMVSVAFNPTAAMTYNGQVIFANNCGNVTNTVNGSGIAAPMPPSPVISICVTNNDVLIRFVSITNQQYIIQRSAVLPFADIVTVTNVSGTGSLIEVKDANAVATSSASFYRFFWQ